MLRNATELSQLPRVSLLTTDFNNSCCQKLETESLESENDTVAKMRGKPYIYLIYKVSSVY